MASAHQRSDAGAANRFEGRIFGAQGRCNRSEQVLALSQRAAPECARQRGMTLHGGEAGEQDRLLILACILYQLRRRRGQLFGGDLFAEPGWDMLLDLYIAGREMRSVCVSSACLGSSSPQTTGLRWMRTLEEKGLVERRMDRSDRRRIYVRLTEQAERQMEALLREAAWLLRLEF